jgi:Protein of unknown function (DUF1203)
MNHSFQLVGIDPAPFAALFELSDEALGAHRAKRYVATEQPGFPCRVSLEDAKVGEELLLLPYLHQPAHSPYQASGPIFVRLGATLKRLPVGEISAYVSSRLLSVRAYDAADMMLAASVCNGEVLVEEINRMFGDGAVTYLHLHNAKRGCFFCRVERA